MVAIETRFPVLALVPLSSPLNVIYLNRKFSRNRKNAGCDSVPFLRSNMAKQIYIVIIISNFGSEFLAASVGIF